MATSVGVLLTAFVLGSRLASAMHPLKIGKIEEDQKAQNAFKAIFAEHGLNNVVFLSTSNFRGMTDSVDNGSHFKWAATPVVYLLEPKEMEIHPARMAFFVRKQVHMIATNAALKGCVIATVATIVLFLLTHSIFVMTVSSVVVSMFAASKCSGQSMAYALEHSPHQERVDALNVALKYVSKHSSYSTEVGSRVWVYDFTADSLKRDLSLSLLKDYIAEHSVNGQTNIDAVIDQFYSEVILIRQEEDVLDLKRWMQRLLPQASLAPMEA